jgi:hypothetical protein
VAHGPLIDCVSRLLRRKSYDEPKAALAFNAHAAFAHFRGSAGKSLKIQEVGCLLPDLSTGGPQFSPLLLWTNPVLDGAKLPGPGLRVNTAVCLFFKQRGRCSLKSRTYGVSQASFHKPSTALSRCFVESRYQNVRQRTDAGDAPCQASVSHVRDAPQNPWHGFA